MGLFDKLLVKKGEDGLPESFAALYKATNCEQKGYDVHYGFRCLEKMYRIGKQALAEEKMSGGDFGTIKSDHFFPRITDLAEVYKDGEYWYDDVEKGKLYRFKVCEPDMAKHYECFATLADAAEKLSRNFSKNYVLQNDTMNRVPDYFLQAGIGYARGYLKSTSADIKSKKIAAIYLTKAFELGCQRYGYIPDYYLSEDTSFVANHALKELVELSEYIPFPLHDYVKTAQKNNVTLWNELLERVKEVDGN